jgi:hypothetical protein
MTTEKAASKRKAAVPAVRDNLPAGATVALDPETCSAFARIFREALQARGYGLVPGPNEKNPDNEGRT